MSFLGILSINRVTLQLQKDIRGLEQECARLREELKLKETRLREIEMELRRITAEPTTMEAETEKEDLEKCVELMREKVDRIRNKSVQIDPKEKKSIEDKYSKYVTGYRKRKKMCNEIIDAIMESYPKTKKHLIDEIGIETDELADFVLPT